jgi:dTDP-D-glucose 4,6-dehydratase
MNFILRPLNGTECDVIDVDKLTHAGKLRNIQEQRDERRHKLDLRYS